jgi:hypothetical protein
VKELTATFHSEVFRPIVTLVVPGFYATASISISLLERFGSLRALIDKYPGAATLVFLLVVLAGGLTAEEVGARIELHFDNAVKKCPGYEGHREEWFDYLRLAFNKEPIGHRYLRSLVLRLKFELGMAVATVQFALGALCLRISWVWRSIVAAVSLGLGIYLYIEARSSNKTLSELRREMLKKDWN